MALDLEQVYREPPETAGDSAGTLWKQQHITTTA